MQKIINVDVLNETDLIEKYNSECINNELINYLIKKSFNIKLDENIKIVINNNCNTKLNIANLIRDGLEKELAVCIETNNRNNLVQFSLFLMGILFLVIATFIKNSILNQILVIIGWVPIWKMAQVELFDDFRGRKRKQIIKKLLISEIKVIKKEN